MKTIEWLYRNYKEDLYSYILSLSKNQEEAEDILSETYLRALRGIWSFRAESSIKTWLFSIARNVWYESLRKNPMEESFEGYLSYRLEENLEDQALNKILAQRIIQILESEDSRSRKVFRLKLLGYSHREIGEKLNISESSSRVIYYRVREKTRNTLAQEGVEENDIL